MFGREKMQALGQEWSKLVVDSTQDSRPEASFRLLPIVTHLTTVNASAVEQADKSFTSAVADPSKRILSKEALGGQEDKTLISY